jgi:putative ATP-dependent endonuclease of the OLD family
MPRLERVSSADFQNPDAMIQQTLRAVAATVVAPVNPDTGEANEVDALVNLRHQIQERLNEEIDKVKATLQRIHPRIRDVRVSPTVDFTRSVTTTNLLLDTGDGDRLIDAFGEGTKKRLWMGLLEWERQARGRGVSGNVIRLYDEPDVHLHYEAQRELFQNISDLASDSSLRTQCFVCTHSVTLVDRAPSRSINLIRVAQDNSRTIASIRSGGDPELARFFSDVGRAVGLSNTVLLYERGFLLVEGESEAEAIPILYRNLYGRSLVEDGLVLVNLHTCSAWKSVLQVLLANRLDMTHILLDSDCRSPESSGYMTVESLTALNCSADFLSEQVTYIGTKEYEDAFSNDVIARALNDQFPLPDGAWDGEAVQEVRANTTKFSDELVQKVRRTCIPQYRSNVRKPSVAAAVAKQCTTPADVPNEILNALTRLRARAGIVP